VPAQSGPSRWDCADSPADALCCGAKIDDQVGGGDADIAVILERVLFHLLQEYARHLGHLDIVSELADGEIGE
jgi:hypothetical protein